MSARDVEAAVDVYGRLDHGLAADLDVDDLVTVLDALAAAGYAVVKLPEPSGSWAEGPEWVQGGGVGARSGWVTWAAHRSLVMLQRVEPGELSPAEARELAAALLAAAAHTEAGDPA